MSVSGGQAVSGRHSSSLEPRDFYQLKQRAAEYYRSNAVPQRMQQVLNTMFYEKPDDMYGHLANYFASFAKPAAISRIIGREILDTNGQSTIEVEVLCTIKNFEKSICVAAMSNCCSDPNYTPQDTGNNDNEEKAQSVNIALEWVNEPLNSLLKGLLPANQIHVDKLLSEYFQRKVEEDEEQKKKDNEEEKLTEPESLPPPVSAAFGDKKKKSPKGLFKIHFRVVIQTEQQRYVQELNLSILYRQFTLTNSAKMGAFVMCLTMIGGAQFLCWPRPGT